MPPNYRCCVSCRRTVHRSELVRVVRRHPDRIVVIGEGMGRSAYICPNLSCLQLAQKKNRLSRALRGPVPPTLYQALVEHLALVDKVSPDGSN